MEFIHYTDEEPLALGPHRIIRPSENCRLDLLHRKSEAATIKQDMHAPLVLRTAPRAGTVDHDLPLDRIQGPEIQEVATDAPELVEDVRVVGDRSEEFERFDARPTHHPLKRSRDLRIVGRLDRCQARGDLLRCHAACLLRLSELPCYGFRSAV